MDTIKTVKQAYSRLLEQFNDIDSNEAWMNYLQFQSRFHRYSFNNAMLIMLQKPRATFVAGYVKWQQLGRQVKAGEHAIKIFAPVVYKQKDTTTNNEEALLKGFRLASIFDISQTSGEETSTIPEVVAGLNEQVVPNEEMFWVIASLAGVDVNLDDNIRVKGMYNKETYRITVHAGFSWTQKIKTLIHEYAHHLVNKESIEINRKMEEMVVESVSFIVADYLGFDTSNYTIPYLGSWGKDTDTLWQYGALIQRLSNKIILQYTQKDSAQSAFFNAYNEEDMKHVG